MIFVLIGLSSFVFFFIFDKNKLNGGSAINPYLNAMGFIILNVSTIMTIIKSKAHLAPIGQVVIGCILAFLGIILVVYSIFIELPNDTFRAETKKTKVYRNGTYALCRHPSALWLIMVYIGIYLVWPGNIMLVMGIVISAANTIYVYIQEKFFFTELFTDYNEYKEKTPMLVPNKISIKRCLDTIGTKK